MKKNSISILNDLFDENFSLFQIKNDFYSLRTNIKELEDKYIFEINVAGIKKENISIDIEDEYLIVSVTEEIKEEDNQENYIRREMKYSNLKRKYYIGNISKDNITASIENGILNIILLKQINEKKNSKIEIK